MLAFFTLSPFKLPHYGLPAYPALALLAARAWRDAAPRPRGLIAAHLVLFALAGAGCAWAAVGDGRVFTEAVFGVSDVYSRKEAALGQAVALSRLVVAAAAGGVGGSRCCSRAPRSSGPRRCDARRAWAPGRWPR